MDLPYATMLRFRDRDPGPPVDAASPKFFTHALAQYYKSLDRAEIEWRANDWTRQYPHKLLPIGAPVIESALGKPRVRRDVQSGLQRPFAHTGETPRVASRGIVDSLVQLPIGPL